jgi:hypothetical protein
MKSVFIEPEKVMAFNSDGHAFVVRIGVPDLTGDQ